ncbi:MAG: fibronectin type III domain-containing protein, partial [Bacteroidota bacterium]
QFYISYMVEKSEDGVSWVELNDVPFINTDRGPRGERYAYMVDSLEMNNKPYFYRVKGRTPFDRYGPPSDVVQGMGIDPQPTYYPSIDGIYESTEGAFSVQWTFDELQNSQISGFYVRRAPRDEGPYETVSDLLPAEVRSFIDPSPGATNYYKVIAMDAYGREMPSFSALAQLYDETPPAPPENVRGRIMDDGTLVITWDPNTEEDFFGNRVFVANDSSAEFTQITPQPTTTGYFIDSVSLNTLSEELFVKVTAQDYRSNTSDFSEMVMITRPDSVPPSAPIFNAFETGVEMVSLAWANSSSHDLTKTSLQRREQGTEEWQIVAEFSFPEDANVDFYDDENVTPGTRYEYMLTATDDAELSTDSRTIIVQTLRDLEADPIEDLNISADRREKEVKLSWQYTDEDGLEYFRIYRSLDDGIPLSFKTVSREDALLREASGNRASRYGFSDDEVMMNTSYQYQVKAVFAEGKQSPKSELVQINY